MAVIEGGVSAALVGVDAEAAKPMHITAKPVPYGALGHYRFARNIPLLVTQAANGTLLSFRWGDATRLAVIGKIKLSVMQTAAATATIMPRFEVFIARGFTVSDSVGTVLTLSGNSFKKRTSMGTSLVTDIRHSAVAAGLTVGTRTLDADPILSLSTNQTITTPNSYLYTSELDIGAADGNHPIILAQNEGIIVRGPTTVFGAAGTADLVVEISWAEVASY